MGSWSSGQELPKPQRVVWAAVLHLAPHPHATICFPFGKDGGRALPNINLFSLLCCYSLTTCGGQHAVALVRKHEIRGTACEVLAPQTLQLQGCPPEYGHSAGQMTGVFNTSSTDF